MINTGMNDPAELMEFAGVKPTSNRVIVLREMMSVAQPLSLLELETRLVTLDRSSILRVLTVFHEHDVVHTFEDGRGVIKYEICHGDHDSSIDDMHPHFFCEVCNKVYCFEEMAVPSVSIPSSFYLKSINYMMKGICPDCRQK